METPHVVTNKEGAVFKLQINRPAKKNAITSEMYTQLSEGLTAAQTDPEVRVVFITGSEDSFTSGNDLNDFLQNPPTDSSSPVFRFLQAISTAEKPIIAAVNGLAIGVGTTLLLHCDLVYAAENAVFQLPFVNLALVPEAGSSLILPLMLGHVRAAELLLLGDKFSAQKAAEYGIVNEVVGAEDLETLALEKADALARKAPEALRLSKRLMKKANAKLIAQTIGEEGAVFTERLRSPEAKEVMQAFTERRAANFSKLEAV